ncbi:site-specific integrase [Hymenobacter rubidus]|uniref:site-specific integrase n=1 Tax=Hymenobacter rubidus TaxID=1441626 RepID=UPI00191F3A1B|nr:site-specific integrase [Hymenobacter rubidus]
MAKVTFLLYNPAADKPTPIIASVTFDGQRHKVYVGISILPKQWDKKEQKALTRGYSHTNNGKLNDTLENTRERLTKCYDDHRAVGTLPSLATLKKVAEPVEAEPLPEPEATAPEPTPAGPNLLTVFSEWIESRSLTQSPNTLRTYRTSLRHLRDLQQLEGYAVDFATVGNSFAERFARYLLTKRNLVDSAVHKNLFRLKHFLNWALDNGYPVIADPKKFSWQHREPDILTLTRQEVQRLADLDLSARPALDNARALFMLGVYTGLRFSDVASLRPEHIQADRLRVTTQKTRLTVTVPVRPEARPLLARVTEGTLRPLANQKLNGHLKELARLAEIDAPTERVRYAGGQRRATTAPKYEFVTTHTARRTFVTLALEAGVRPEVVMRITGHKSLSAFRRYVNVTEDTMLDEFSRAFA